MVLVVVGVAFIFLCHGDKAVLQRGGSSGGKSFIERGGMESGGQWVGDELDALSGLPVELKAGNILFSEAVERDEGDGWIVRSLVETGTRLGRILVEEPADSGNPGRSMPAIFSASHLVVSGNDVGVLHESHSDILEAGYQTLRLPYDSYSFQVDISWVETPSDIYEQQLKIRALLPSTIEVELDGAGRGAGAPTDPSYDRQWHHAQIGSEAVWDMTRGDQSILVAVLDTGINFTTPEFEGRISADGYDFANDDDDPTDDHGHGTAVAGVIAANANNGHLLAGVDWSCQILPVKVLDSSNWGFYSWWASGVRYSVEQGARVINLSAGGSGGSSSLTRAIESAIASGVVFVTITNNDGEGNVDYPGNLEAPITVGATERDGSKTSFSNWGEGIDMVAPGRDIFTVNLSGNLSSWWGTSFAAPQVAGAAALLLSLNPELDHHSIASLLTAGAEDLIGDDNDTPGFDDYYGWGRLNIYNSLILAQTLPEISIHSSGGVSLKWISPPNASSRNPYDIYWSTDLKSWEMVESPDIQYTERAEWVDGNSLNPDVPNQRFYRLSIRP